MTLNTVRLCDTLHNADNPLSGGSITLGGGGRGRQLVYPRGSASRNPSQEAFRGLEQHLTGPGELIG